MWAGPDEAAAAEEARHLAALAAEHGAGLVLAVTLDATLPDPARARDGLGRLAVTVAEAGAAACLEFLPWTAVPTLAAAWEMVRDVPGQPGIVLDTWHWQRQPGGPSPDVLAGIPGSRIAYIQVCDAGPEPAADVMDEAMTARLLPGDGVVDFGGLFTALGRIGADPFVATEVFNPSVVRSQGKAAAAVAMARAAREVVR